MHCWTRGGRTKIAGCAVVISRDRWFPDTIATHTLAFEGESKVALFKGNVSEYEGCRRQTRHDAATQPQSVGQQGT